MNETLEILKSRLDAHRPFNPEQQAKIDSVLLPRRIHLTNAFGDNSLTLEETRYYLETQRLIGGKLEREFQEIRGVQQAIQLLERMLAQGEDLSEAAIQNIHHALMTLADQEGRYQPGQYRTLEAYYLDKDGSRISFSPYALIPMQIAALLKWYHDEAQQLPPLERTARFHFRLVMIHPFVEGNGRLARLLDDFILEKSGLGPALVESSEVYFSTLRAADRSLPQGEHDPIKEKTDLTSFSAVIEEGCRIGLNLMLDVLEERLQPTGVSLESRMEIFDKILSGNAASAEDRHLSEDKETTKLAMARELEETLKQKVRSKFVKFVLSGPAKFQQNNQQYSLLIAEITQRHKYTFSPSEVHYEYHLAPDLNEVESSGLSLKPFMRLLSFAILSHGQTVGMFSGVLEFEFGRVYIKQENRSELILNLQRESIRELIGSAAYQDWDFKTLKSFIFNSLDNYFHQMETEYLKVTPNAAK